jgi:hypothetical protein
VTSSVRRKYRRYRAPTAKKALNANPVPSRPFRGLQDAYTSLRTQGSGHLACRAMGFGHFSKAYLWIETSKDLHTCWRT